MKIASTLTITFGLLIILSGLVSAYHNNPSFVYKGAYYKTLTSSDYDTLAQYGKNPIAFKSKSGLPATTFTTRYDNYLAYRDFHGQLIVQKVVAPRYHHSDYYGASYHHNPGMVVW